MPRSQVIDEKTIKPIDPTMSATHIPELPNRRTVLVLAVAAFVLALGLRLAHFDNEPITDELYHLIAAESWVENGSFEIADGEYTRASFFTVLVGIAHRASNGNIDTIRIVCITLGALLVAAVTAWTCRYAGAGAAAISGLLLAILPAAIFLSQYIRFYSLHALVFFLVAWSVWELNRAPSPGRRWLFAGLAIALALLGLHLQITTMVGVAGLLLWLLLMNGRSFLALLPGARHRWIAGSVLIALMLLVAFAMRDTISVLIEVYTASALWNSSDTPLFYFTLYRNDFGVLWSLAPAAFLVALIARPAPALLCTCVFVVAFIVQSLGGMRSERFMFYALPFFFIAWGIAIDATGRALTRWLRDSLSDFDLIARHPMLRVSLPVIAALAIAVFALLTTPFFEASAKMTLGRKTQPPEYWDRYRTNWAEVVPFLREIRQQHDVVIASQPLHAIYYLGDVDYVLNATMLADVARPGIRAALDRRTGRVIFDDVASLQAIVRCHDSGSVIIHGPAFGNPTRVAPDVARFIAAHLDEIPVPGKTDMLVYGWQDNGGGRDCELRNGRWNPHDN